MVRKIVLGFLSLLLSLPVFADGEVNVYSARKESLIKPLLDKFSAETGIKVNFITAKAEALQKKLELEGANTPADVLITTDAGNLSRAKQAGLLQAVDSSILRQNIPAHLRDVDNQWFGLTYRARPIFYVPGRVQAQELSSYENLADPKWQGRICIRSSDNVYNQSMLASMIAASGVEATQKWADAFVKNFAQPPMGGDRDQIKAAAAGLCDIAIANTYYLVQMLQSEDPMEQAAANRVLIFWPNQADRGTHIILERHRWS